MSLQISLAHQFEQQMGQTWDLCFSLDGKRLVSSDGTVLRLWQFDESGSWRYERALAFRRAALPCLAPDGMLLAFRDHEQFLRLITLDNRREVVTSPSPALADCAFSPDQRWLVSSDTAYNILLWDLLTSQFSSISVEDGAGRNFRFTPDGQRLIFSSAGPQGNVQICRFDPAKRSLRLQTTFTHRCIDMAISPNGKRLAMIVPNQQLYYSKDEVYIYDLESLQLLHVFPQTTDEGYCLLAFSPDSHYLASCKSDGFVEIFSLDPFETNTVFAAHPGLASHATEPIGGLDWSRTGFIATGEASVFEDDPLWEDYTIKLWKVES